MVSSSVWRSMGLVGWASKPGAVDFWRSSSVPQPERAMERTGYWDLSWRVRSVPEASGRAMSEMTGLKRGCWAFLRASATVLAALTRQRKVVRRFQGVQTVRISRS
jgi:hypothetical protein